MNEPKINPHYQDLTAALREVNDSAAAQALPSTAEATRVTTIYLPVDLHRDLRRAALYRNVSLSALICDLVETWLAAADAPVSPSLPPEAGNVKRTTIHMPAELHRRWRLSALEQASSMTAVLRYLATRWRETNKTL